MKDEFKEFTGKGDRLSSRIPMVTIRKDGKISPNERAYDLLGRPKYVVLSYAATRCAMGIEPANKRIPYAYLVTHDGNSSTCVISGKAFLRHVGVAFGDVSRAYRAHMEEGMLVVDLDQDSSLNNSP